MENVNVNKNKCERCGIEFLTKDPNEKICLGCRITEEMKLPENTIVNQNVLNIYMSQKYDKIKGVDPTYLMVAEGVCLLNRKRDEEQLCSKIKLIGNKDNSEIEKYVKSLKSSGTYKKKYDAMVFVKVNSHSNFIVFGLSYSDRLYNILSEKDDLYKKNYAISLAINWYFKKIS